MENSNQTGGPMIVAFGDGNQVAYSITNNYQGNAYNGKNHNGARENRMPTAEKMSDALRRTVSEGYWWSNRAWAVVYRVCQMLGYTGSYSTFVEDAGKWAVDTGYELNYDAIQKPMAKGWLIGPVGNWERQGAAKAFPVLANALLDMLGIDPQTL